MGVWRAGLAEATADLEALVFPVQVGGPVGTSREGAADLAGRLGLADAPPWHTQRRPVTRAGDALVAATDACGRIARDVLVLGRPEIGELSEAVGGGSSSMPHKANPVLSVLVRRAALTTPQLAATLHLAAADQVDERADGAWHAEWDTLRLLARRTAVAASQTAELLEGLRGAPRPDGGEPRRRRGGAMSTLVLGPSIGTSADSCWGAAAALLRDEFEVVAWELPGHGTDRGPGPRSTSPSRTSPPACWHRSTVRSSTPATRSGARSGCSCCSTPRTGCSVPCSAAPARRSATTRCGATASPRSAPPAPPRW